jgi:CHAT domain-containing protein/exonuclease VII small subunit
MKLKKWLVGIICWGLIASFVQATTQEEQIRLMAADMYHSAATSHYKQEKFSKALFFAEKAFKIRMEILGEKHPDTLTSLNNLASIYDSISGLDEFLPLLYECGYRLRKEVLGEKHPDTLGSLNNLALIYQYLGHLYEALPLFEKSLRLRKEVLGEKHPDTLQSLNNLASIYQDIGRDEALPFSKNCYRLRKEVLGEKHPDTLVSLNNLALIYRDLGHLDEALPLSEKGLCLTKEVLGEKHPYTLFSLNILALIYLDLGHLDEALLLFEKGLRLTKELKEVLGEKHPDTLQSLNNLALIYRNLGNLDEALPLFEKGLTQILEALHLSEKGLRSTKEMLGLGEKHLYTLLSLNNLAQIYRDLGHLDEPLPLSEKGLRLHQEVLGEKHPYTLLGLNNLALIYQGQGLGHLDKALPLFEKGFNLIKEVLGTKHPYTFLSLNNLAGIYKARCRLDKALPLYESGYDLSKEVLGAKHPATLRSLNNLAQVYQNLGRLDDALPLYESGYRLRKEGLGAKHPDTLQSLNNLGYAYAEQAQIDKAINHFEQLVEGVETLRQRGDLSAENRQALFKKWIHSYFKLSQLYFEKERFNEAFQMAEMTKARTLLESMSMKLAAQNTGLSTDERDKLQQSQAKIAALNDRIAREIDMDKRLALKMEKNKLVKQAAEFHRVLMQKYPKYAKLNDIQIVTAANGASLIPTDTLLFISYLIKGNHVLIFTLDLTGNLQVKDLGEIPNLKQTLKTYREWLGKECRTDNFRCKNEKGIWKKIWKKADGRFIIGDKPAHAKRRDRVKIEGFTRYLNDMSRDLAQKLLVPIKERLQRLQGKKRLIISPDGALAQIPFETLIVDDKPVIATHSVSYVQSLSVLKLLKERENAYQSITNRGTLLAMGAAPYQVNNRSNETRESSNLDIEKLLTRSSDPQRYQEAFRARGSTWDNLPNSKIELEALKNIFSEARIYQGINASEAQLQKLNENKTLANYHYLVFSAHGHLDMEIPALSAIVLDQVNKTEGTDGYVTASEWPSYDLRSDLMVLSACQTGVGKVMQGEGVMGLPYAFYVAGNKNTLMTLWSVVDKSTAEFVKRFFRKLKNGQSQIDALTETKREFLKEEELEDYTLPLFWAPFVLYGI